MRRVEGGGPGTPGGRGGGGGGGSGGFAVGDRVEALYKGRGTRWFPGKVTRVNAPNFRGEVTYDIDYDDGDRESSALERNVRSFSPQEMRK